jgi:hypothetical protein
MSIGFLPSSGQTSCPIKDRISLPKQADQTNSGEMDIYIKLPEFLRRFPPMSAPAEKTQKTLLLLLHGITPHLFQSRAPLRKSSKLRVMDNSTASHKKLSSGSSESTTNAALEAYEAAQAG